MIWFVLDDKGTTDVLKHGEFSYAVLNVINEAASLNNDADKEEEEEEEEMFTTPSSFHRRDTLISDRMISLFFHD